jgi:hypothetical protein
MFAAALNILPMIITVPLFLMTVNDRPRRRRPPSGRSGARPDGGRREPAEAR